MLYFLHGARAGVVGTSSLAVTEKSGTPNMSVDVAEGFVLVAGTESAYQGLYACEAQGTTNVVISAAHATLPRRDLIVARVRDQEYSGVTNSFAIEVVTGTAASPARFPTVPANCLVLATVSIAALDTAINNADITDIRSASASDGLTTLSNLGFGSAVGGRVICTSTTRPTSGLVEGLELYETDTDLTYTYNGSSWVNTGGSLLR